MDLVLFFMLILCSWTAAVRVTWSNKPSLILSSREIDEGESLDVSCTVPIDYRGGDCRLFRGSSSKPFKLVTDTNYICYFRLSSQELLGGRPVGSKTYLRCDYKLQDFTSISSDKMGVTVWGTRPSPGLSISRHFISPNDSIEMICTPPPVVSWCHFYRDTFSFGKGSCRRNMTGRQLTVGEKPTLLFPLRLSCTYDPVGNLDIRSKPSNQQLLFVVDASSVTSSVDCRVSGFSDQLKAFKGSNWKTVGENGVTVTVQVTNSNLTMDHTCS